MTNLHELQSTLQIINQKGMGILAADESTGTITKRFDAIGIASNEDNRRAYREMLLTADGVEKYIAGVILYEETLNQKTSKGISFPELLANKGILPGIKVDKGLVYLPNTDNENITQGLDGLPERLATYKAKGAKFAKWRAVYSITATTPSQLLIDTNAEILARYAAICQDQGIVPIVEPEVLIDGDHPLEKCEAVSLKVFKAVFDALKRHKVKLEYIILKPSMVINGKNAKEKASVQEVAEATIRVLKETVPDTVPTINFLSGGQSSAQATAHLNAMNKLGPHSWNLSFSYARALQECSMKAWKGDEANIAAAQKVFSKRAKLNSLASEGAYDPTMETATINA